MHFFLRLVVLVAVPVAVVVMIVRFFSSDERQQVLPEGPQIISGILRPVPLSLDRRGTHLLRKDDVDVAFVESARSLLRSYEGLEVTLHGTLEYNTDPTALPVLVATDVTLLQSPSRIWTVASPSLTFESPMDWEGEETDVGIKMTKAGIVGPMLTITKANIAQLPAGVSLQVDERRAVFVRESTGDNVFVQNGEDVVVFSFRSSSDDNVMLSPIQLLLMRSVRFPMNASGDAASQASDGIFSSVSDILGNPCGGSAGVLCPEDSYCEIIDSMEGIGRCRKLR